MQDPVDDVAPAQSVASLAGGAATAASEAGGRVSDPAVGTETIVILVNVESGTVLTLGAAGLRQELLAATKAWKSRPDLRFVRGHELDGALKQAFADKAASTVVVAGGDGSVSAAARLAVETGKTLGVLPCGTFNLFARSLGVGPGLADALAGMASWRRDEVDIGRVNGETFLHHVSLGLHPRMIRARNAVGYDSRLGKIRVAILAWMRTARTVPRYALRITTDGETRVGRFTSVFVSVNTLRELSGPAPVSVDPKGGLLDLHLAEVRSTSKLLSMAALSIVGLWRSNPHLTVIPAQTATIVTHKRAMRASVDGELRRLNTPIEIVGEPKRLAVLRP